MAILLLAAAAAAAEPPAPGEQPDVSLRQEVEQAFGGYAFSVVGGRTPRVIYRGPSVLVRLELRNEGSLPWEPEAGISLSYHWLSLDGRIRERDGVRTPLTVEVQPGERVEMEAELRRPAEWGLYRLQWDLVEEGVAWFSQRDPSPEPAPLVLVLPLELLTAASLPVLGLLLAFGARALSLRGLDRAIAAPVLSRADLVWLGLGLFGKPLYLYYEISMEPSTRASWITLSCVCAVLLPLAFAPARLRPVLSWVTAAGAAAYLWGDVLYYRFFADLASTPSLLAYRQTGDLADSIRFLLRGRDALLFFDLPLALPLVAAMVRRPAPTARRAGRLRALPLAALVLALLPGLLAVWAGLWREDGRHRRTRPPLRAVEDLGLYGFQIQDLVAQLGRRLIRAPLGEAEVEELVSWFAQRAPVRSLEGGGGPVAGRSLILIQVESLQQFALQLDFDGRRVMPNLEEMAGRAARWAWFRDQTSKGRSSDADFIAMTSILPVADSVAYEYPGNDFQTLAGVLRRHGYATLSAVPFTPRFWNRQVTHPAYGFEATLFEEDFLPGQEIGWGLSDRDFLTQMVPRILDLPRPFALWLTTLSVHYPYVDFPEEDKVLDLGPWEGSSLGNYLHGMSFFDRALGELLGELEERDTLDEVVIVLWGDHDSTLHLQKEFRSVLGIDALDPGRFLADRVPFMIFAPGRNDLAGERNLPAGHLDIVPTVLAALGIDASPYAFMGRNLLADPPAEPVAHPRGSWMDDRLVYLSEAEGLAQGSCWQRQPLMPVPVEECAAGSHLVERQREVAATLLRYDLQQRIGERLAERSLQAEGTPPEIR